MAVYLGSNMVSLFGGQLVEGMDIKKLTATLNSHQTATITMLTDPQLLKARNDPNGFVMMRYLGLTSGVSCNMFWFTCNFTIGYNNQASPATAYNSLIIRGTSTGSIQGNFNVNGLVGDNYNGHLNVSSSGGLVIYYNSTYPLQAGEYEIIAGIWKNVNITNLIPLSVEKTSTAIYNNGLGYKNGYYISSGNESANSADCMTGLIPYQFSSNFQPTYDIYIKGYTGAANASHTRMDLLKPDKTNITETNGFLSSNPVFDVEQLDTNYYKLTPKTGVQHSYSTVGWLQFSFNQPDASKIIITKGEPINR